VIMDDADHSPLPPDQLDEVLSADLDGALDAAAHDLGLGADTLAARVRATPGAAERRAALAAARAALGQVPELDELAAARLRSTALLAAEREDAYRDRASRPLGGTDRRSRSWLVAVAGTAAAVAAIGGLAVAIGQTSSNSKSSSSAAPSEAPESRGAAKEAAGSGGSLGTFGDVHSLALTAVARDRSSPVSGTTERTPPNLQDGLSKRTVTTTVPARTNSSSGDSTTGNKSTSVDAGPVTGPASTTVAGPPAFSAAALQRRAQTCSAPLEVPVSGEPVVRATATLAGQPVVVLVYAGNHEHIVVIENPQCGLLHVQTLA
jgi:hypothetical protein